MTWKINFPDEWAEKLEEIYRAQEKPRFYKFSVDLNDQFMYLEDCLEGYNITVDVKRVRQNCDNIHVTVAGDRDQIAWMDSKLIAYSTREQHKHLLVLEWDNGL